MYILGIYNLGSYTSGVSNLRRPILKLVMHSLGFYTLAGYTLGVDTVGGFTLGVATLGQPILDLVMHSLGSTH